MVEPLGNDCALGGEMKLDQTVLSHTHFIITYNAGGDVTNANDLCQEVWHDKSNLLGCAFHDLVVDCSRDVWSLLHQGQTVSATHKAGHCAQKSQLLDSVFVPVFDKGRLHNVVQLSSDRIQQGRHYSERSGQIAAINNSSAVVHFTLDGHVVYANRQFLESMGYAEGDVIGRHHTMFLAPEDLESDDYATLWSDLAKGLHRCGEYRRIGENGKHVWLQATYVPIFDTDGTPIGVVEYASDITDAKLAQADYQWQIAAISKSNAVITFDMHGSVLSANELFLEATGYSLDEIVGRHHRMFVDDAYAHSDEYAQFWQDLRHGKHHSGKYRRRGKGGREIWLHASYNPIFDTRGRAVKVVKYAGVVTDATLRDADNQGQIAAIHASQCVVSYDLHGNIIDANDLFLSLMGYRYSEVRGCAHSMFLDIEDVSRPDYLNFWVGLSQGRHQTGEFKRRGKDGREVWLQSSYTPICDMNNRPFKIVEYARDVTAEKLRRADHQGQIEAINKSHGVVTLGLDGLILDANDNFLSLLGYALADIQGQHHSIMLESSEVLTDTYREFWQKLRAGEFQSGVHKRIGGDGREVWIQASYNPIFDLSGRPYKIIKYAADVTSNVSMAAAFEQARREAQHDPATALPNRTRLASFLQSALSADNGRVVALYIDLDNFKQINDAHGHFVGDRVLGEIADRLRRTLRRDQLAARVGGDEFVVIAPLLADREIEPYCRRLISTLSQPLVHDGQVLKLGASIGIAVAPGDATSPDELLRCADAALYSSKNTGRGSFSFYSKDLNDRYVAEREMIAEMRGGLANDEFILEYQPRFDTKTLAIKSAEALLRWSHPTRGLIAPTDFIPLAERSGLIAPLGRWVLQAACQTAIRWHGLAVSVNVSPVQFSDRDFVSMVASILADTGLPPHLLELEITEGVLVEEQYAARLKLDSLKELGVRLAIDDFGTGYSSLAYLQTFPFDVIKIDKRFVTRITKSSGDRAIVQAIIALSRALNVSVTAEGVETAEQLAILSSDQCPEVQGFFLSKPISEDSLLKILQDGQTAQVNSEQFDHQLECVNAF